MRNIQNLKLMPDYNCFPLWCMDPDEYDNIDPNELPLSNRLKQDLTAWAGRYDAILNWDDPVNSDFKSEEEEQQFKEDGKELHQRLQEELKGKVKVTYYVP